jgi:hypothetical protein
LKRRLPNDVEQKQASLEGVDPADGIQGGLTGLGVG